MILRFFALGFIATLLAGCTAKEEPKAAVETPALVRAQRIIEAVAPSRAFPGTLSAQRSADVAFVVGGLVTEVAAGTGEKVVPGQLLAALDSRDFDSRLQAAKAEAQRASAEEARARSLLEQNAIAPARVDALSSTAQAATAALAQAEKALDDTRLRAPFAGVVAARFIERYSNHQAKDLAYRIHDLSSFLVAIDLPQTLVLASQGRSKGNPAASGEVSYRAYFNHPEAAAAGYALQVSSFSTDPDPRTGTYRFKLVLPAPEGLSLLPGMSCTVRITLPQAIAGQVFVPPSAVGTDKAGAPVAWVVDGQGRAQPRAITVGALTAQGLAVTSGLATGEVVITAGLAQLTPGRAVRVL